MPTKHISDAAWKRVERHTYETVIRTGKVVKESEVLNYLIRKGAEDMSEEDYKKIAKK